MHEKNGKGAIIMKKLLAMILAAILALGCLGAATAEETLKVWVPDNLRVEWDNNDMTTWLEEQLGAKLVIEAFPEDGYLTQLNNTLTLNNNLNDWPDVIMTKNFNLDDYVTEWGAAEAIIPLEEYYANPELTENLQKAFERCGSEYYKQLTSPDGHVYMIGTMNQSFTNENPDKFYFFSRWLKELNLEVPTTTDEFYEVLKAIKGKDLNGNGKDDEVGLAGTFGRNKSYSNWFNGLMNAFVYAGDPNFRVVTDGVVSMAYTTEEWREGLRYIRKLFEEGLIASETLTMDNATYESITGLDEQVEAFQIWFTPLSIAEADIEEYIGMAPLKGPQGVQYVTYRASSPAGRMCITAACKNPELAFKLGDLMSSEKVGISQRFGQEGVDWDYYENIQPELIVAEKKKTAEKKGEDPNAITDFDVSILVPAVEGLPISIYTYHDGDYWGGSGVQHASWMQAGPFVRHYGIVSGWAQEPGDKGQGAIVNANALLYQTGGFKPEETIPKTVLTDEENDMISEIASTLNTFVEEQTALFLSGAKSLDNDWDAFQNELKAIGVEQYVQVMQNMYDRMYK